ncbi:homocysteine S-methyltransferase family protein [Parabacteroides sp. OttesenSCG-928-G07]|nr:homocysteine S-methyltransferase family protein [Parabacteroides sp. OttesenSCG-928-G21]MDL2277464.1 homocysteine S-methyltransferase family protein [Parabacteroides sp. OttesenSCG-928-G07]
MNFQATIMSSPAILMEGALGERLKREYHLEIGETVAMANLIYDADGKTALKALWEQYIDIARKYNLPFMATTPTRRANKERVAFSAYDDSIISQNVAFLREIKNEANIEMYVGGLLGCKGDAYTGEGSLDIEEAKIFHSWQINLFKAANVDFLMAGIMPTLSEATGMSMAMSETNIPYLISFTIQEDGKLIDGHTIDYAIRFIDDSVINKPVGYMTNCVHPNIVYKALAHSFNKTAIVKRRFMGIQANTSALPYSELDHSKDLKTSLPTDWANDVMRLKSAYGFKLFGGCCGTDNRHLEEMAKQLKG